VAGEDLNVAGANILRSKAPGKRFLVSMHPLVAQTTSADDWVAQVRQQAAANGKIPLDQAWAQHRAWWQVFRQWSEIVVSGPPEAELVGQGYNLQRFMAACAGRGRYPIQYGGSIFTVDGTKETAGNRGGLGIPGVYDADFRMWGRAYRFQNTRLLYWHALMAGDFDIMQPLFRMKYLIPALQYDVLANWENPELYAVFPYRLFGLGKPHLEVARETYARRLNKGTGCWRQDAVQAAMLGLTDDARTYVARNCANKHQHSRFPGFLYHGWDWIPDVDQGGVIMIALQRMLLQCDGDRILLLPAWPKDWDVSFKLHAPKRTTVECVYRGGKVQSLKVTPEARQKDVEVIATVESTGPKK
jgi:hypothetical protein